MEEVVSVWPSRAAAGCKQMEGTLSTRMDSKGPALFLMYSVNIRAGNLSVFPPVWRAARGPLPHPGRGPRGRWGCGRGRRLLRAGFECGIGMGAGKRREFFPTTRSFRGVSVAKRFGLLLSRRRSINRPRECLRGQLTRSRSTRRPRRWLRCRLKCRRSTRSARRRKRAARHRCRSSAHARPQIRPTVRRSSARSRANVSLRKVIPRSPMPGQ